MAWRFFRRFSVLPWVSLNVSKTGASVSVGPQGAKLTTGTHGTHVTVGLPGSGLHITEKLAVGSWLPGLANTERLEWRQAFIDHLVKCLQDPEVTVAAMRAALDYRHTLKLTDEELGPNILEVIARIQGKLIAAEAAGYTRFNEE